MVHVDLNKILSDEDAVGQIKDLINEVEAQKELYVLTKAGKPAAAIINIEYLEELTGSEVAPDSETTDDLAPENQKETPMPNQPANQMNDDDQPLIDEELPEPLPTSQPSQVPAQTPPMPQMPPQTNPVQEASPLANQPYIPVPPEPNPVNPTPPPASPPLQPPSPNPINPGAPMTSAPLPNENPDEDDNGSPLV